MLLLWSAAAIAAEPDGPRTPPEGSWVPEPLAIWAEGLALFHSSREDEGLAWLLERRRERPQDPCGFLFEAAAYSDFDVGDLSEDVGEERSRNLIEQGLKAAERAPDDPATRYCRAAMYGRRSRDRVQRKSYLGGALDGKRMRRQMRALLEDHPAFSDCQFWLGAYDYYADVLPAYIKFFRTFLFLPKGDRERGIERLEEAASRGVLDRYNAHWTLHHAYGIEGRARDRRDVLERLRAAFPDDLSVVLHLARELVGDRPPNRQRGIALHHEALESLAHRKGALVPRQVFRVQLSLGQLYMASLQPHAAVEILQTALEEIRGNEREELEAAEALAGARIQTGDYAAAVALRESMIERHPDAEGLSALHRRVQEYDARTSRLEDEMMPARRLARDGELDAADVAFRAILERYPDEPFVYLHWAVSHFAQHRYLTAEPLYRKVVDAPPPLKPDFVLPWATLQLGQVCDATNRRREAKALYRRAREIAGDYDGIAGYAGHLLDNAYSPPE